MGIGKIKNRALRASAGVLVAMMTVSHQVYGARINDGSVDSTIEINDGTTNGPFLSDDDRFGNSIANIGDLDGDGVQDLVVGAPFDDNGGDNRGAVHILFMNTDGSVDSTVEINDATVNGPVLSNLDAFGVSVANIGDLNGDGVNDIAVGARADDAGGADRGAIHIMFMNTNGSIDSTVEINDNTTNGPVLANTDLFGTSIANIGDLNSDGVQDLAVGTEGNDIGGTGRGAVHILFMNTDGSIDSTVEINSSTTNGPVLANSDGFGFSLSNIGDLDGDGVNDIAVGTLLGENIHILFMNTDGSLDSTVEIDSTTPNGPVLSAVDYFGSSIANMGDLDGDGVNDIVVGAIGDDNGGSNRGAAHIMFMNTDGSVDSTVEINSSTTNGPVLSDADYSARAVENIGDLNGDGINDLVIGSPLDDNSGSNRGALHILLMSDTGAPVLSSISSSPSTTTATITWTSDESADSTINYGTTTGYGTASTSASLVTSHSITLTGLSESTLYHFEVVSADSSGNTTTSTDYTFTTTSSDVTAPTITSISSDKADGTYTTGEVIDIDVTFSEAVTSTGNVTVTLETGDTDRTCTFTVSNSTTGTCNYTVQAGDNTSDLDATISGTIKDSANNTLVNFTPTTTLATNKAIVIDAVDPILSSITASVTSTTATITWTSDESADSTINYGTTTGYGTASTSASLVTSHSITLTGLSESTLYHFEVVSADSVSNSTTSSDQTFTTTATPSSSSVISTGTRTGNRTGNFVGNKIINNTSNTTSFLITRELEQGSIGEDVKTLQKLLNRFKFTVSAEGPGSFGNETDYYGEKTKQAVMKLQKLFGITPVNGRVGPQTKKSINLLQVVERFLQTKN